MICVLTSPPGHSDVCPHLEIPRFWNLTPWFPDKSLLTTFREAALLSMGFCRQEYWRGCHSLPPGIFPTQGSKPDLLHALQADSLPSEPPRSLWQAVGGEGVGVITFHTAAETYCIWGKIHSAERSAAGPPRKAVHPR